MEKALIFSSGELPETLSLSLSEINIAAETEGCFELSFAVKKIKDGGFDFIIVHSPHASDDTVAFTAEIQKKCETDILFITDLVSAEKFSGRLSEIGIFTLSTPVEKWQINQAVNFIKSAHSRFDSLKKEKDGLKKKVEDMKIIDRAKCCLIQYLGIGEATAHRHIEKQAMDMRCTKRKVAEEILKKYES